MWIYKVMWDYPILFFDIRNRECKGGIDPPLQKWSYCYGVEITCLPGKRYRASSAQAYNLSF